MALRYAGRCSACGGELAKGTRAYWDSEKKAVICLRCLEPDAVEDALDRGRAGGSAAQEWQRRHDKRERRVRERYGRLGGLVLALSDDPQSTSAWACGANGESALGKLLNPLRKEGMAVLHDRRIPGSRANIDHIVIAPAGVFVIDAKNYKGQVQRIDRGGLFSTDYHLYVGRNDQTRLVGGLAKQVVAVRASLGPSLVSVPVIPVICFVSADFPLLSRPFRFGDVHVLWPRALGKLVRADGALAADEIVQIERRLALAMPAAA
jgi:Nuclease-related domain